MGRTRIYTVEEYKERRKESARKWKSKAFLVNPEKIRKACRKSWNKYREKYYDRYRNRYEYNSEMNKTNKRKVRYGVTPEQYDKMLQEQNFACKICGYVSQVGEKALAIDHNHKTGQIRALLCSGCNLGIGNFKENPQFLVAAARYVSGLAVQS